MKEIVLDNSLEITGSGFRAFDPKYFFQDNKDYEPVTMITNEITHTNYMNYLVMCWKRHYGVVISPTILWNMVLGNLAFEVNKNPETYRKYFTDFDEKREIVVDQGDNLISVGLLINALNGLIPDDIMKEFFPEFTTDTDKAIIANYTAFLDMVSPYYNYGMMICGIPKVKILGTTEDWARFRVQCDAISIAIPEFEDYLVRVRINSQDVSQGNNFKNFFSLQRCGSGSQVMVSGWFKEFFIEQPSVAYPENFISCISKINYKNYNEGGKEYRLFAGLFVSKIEDDYLVPEFENIYFVKS